MQSLNYCEELKKRFKENGNKLFFVDGFKNRAFSAVKEILAGESVDSFICAVDSKKTALQIKVALSSSHKNIEIISNLEDLKQMCRSADTDAKRGIGAEKFKKAHPKVIVVLEHNEKPVLHAELHQLNDRTGEYTDGSYACYTVSDFLADGQYDAFVVDNVYDMFAFVEEDADNRSNKSPKKYERIDLKGKIYYTDVAHSYKKLLRLSDSAEKVIVISNTIVDNDIVSFYAGASLINSEFSYKESKKNAKKTSQNYDEDIDRMYDSISYSESDTNIQSLCLQRTKGRKQYIPSDLTRLSGYFTGTLSYMTKEEIFLRAFAALPQKRAGISNDALISMLEDDMTLANTISDMFFSNELKGDIESNVENTLVAKLSDHDRESFFEVFNKYAFYCDTGAINDRCKIYRIYHDDSGFEDLLRRSFEDFDKNENALSASYRGDDTCFKCITVKDLVEKGKLRTPLLIVSQGKVNDIVRSLEKITQFKVAKLPEDCASVAGTDVFATDYAVYESIANDLSFASVIFFDALSDICLFDTYVKKAINMAENTNVALFVTYDNVSGLLADLWQTTWIEENNSLVSIKNSKLYIRGERPLDYHEIVDSISALYNNFKNIVDGQNKVDIKSMTEQFCSVVADFTLGRAAHAKEIEEDFSYFNDIAPYYSAIFANSVSIGNVGREVYSEQLVLQEQKKKRKKPKYAYGNVEETRRVLFNVCSKHLHSLCDIKIKDCSICSLHGKILANDLMDFTKGTRGYFKETERIMGRIQSDRIERQLNDTIGTQGRLDNNLAKAIDHVSTISQEVKETLNIMLKNKISYTAPFFAEYDDISEIKDAVQSVHHMIFVKYFEQIMGILKKSTDELKRSISTIGQAAKNSMNTSQLGGKHGIN